MRPCRKTALEAATGLATVLWLLSPGQALAQDDPFALTPADQPSTDRTASPAQPDSDYVLYADITINGVQLGRLVKLRERNGQLFISADSAVYAGLVSDPGGAEIALNSITGITYSFDHQTYRLDIQKRRRSDGPNAIDLAPQRAEAGAGAGIPVTAFVVDYDLSLQQAAGQTQAGVYVSTRLVRGQNALSSSWRIASYPGDPGRSVVRLDSALTVNLPTELLRMTAGDFVTAGPVSSRAVRLAGLQISRDYSLRPDLVTYPLPDFTGSVAVPTGLDLVINDVRFASATVEPGEFSVRNVPVASGRNRIGVVVHDALGRERIEEIGFYGSPQLLVPGLSSGALNIGFVRHRYGIVSNDYGDLALTATVRHGINRRLTGEASLEVSPHFVNAGLGANFTIGGFASARLGLRGSSLDRPGLAARRGSLIDLSLESGGRSLSLRIDGQFASNGYDDLASAQGDEPPRSQLAISGTLPFLRLGTFNLALVGQRRQRGPWVSDDARDTLVGHATYRNQLGAGASLFVDVSHRQGGGQRPSLSVLVGISVQLGPRTTAQASYSAQSGFGQGEVAIFQPDMVPGDIGFALRAGAGETGSIRGALSYRSTMGRIELQGENVNGVYAARLGASGTLVYADGRLFASQSSSNGFILADGRGVAGVTVLRENRVAGQTGRLGTRMIADVPANTPVAIGIEPSSLPLDVTASRLTDTVVVPAGAVVKVELGVARYVPQLVALRSAGGTPFDPGTRVRALPSGQQYLIGLDSMLEVNTALGDTELRIDSADGGQCHARLLDLQIARPEEPANLICYGVSRTIPIADFVRPRG